MSFTSRLFFTSPVLFKNRLHLANLMRLMLLALLVSTLGLSACTSTAKSGASTAAAQHSGTKGAPASATPVSVLPPGEPTPNPYLQNNPSVSRSVQQEFDTAVLAMEQKKWLQAERLWLNFTRVHPKLSGGQLNLGLVYRALKEPAKAELAFNAAIASNRNNLAAYNQLAILKRQAGEFMAAEALYLQALSVWPYHPESHKNIGILYDLYLGQEVQALAHYQAYQQLTGATDKQLTSWLADLQRRLASKDGG